MAGPPRTPSHSLAAFAGALAEAPWGFGFFQALRRIESGHPDKPRLGKAARPADEPVRLGQDPSLAFAPAALSSYKPAGGMPRLGVEFFGLFGPMGPLPLHLTEYVRERMRDGDAGFSRFADIFHHRLLMLFFRAWANSEPVVSLDRPAEDRFSTYVASMIGLGLPSFGDRDVIPDSFKLAFAGRLAMQSRNAEGLEALLMGDLDVPVRVEEFVPGWAVIADEDRFKLGKGKQAGHLGVNAFLGRKVRHVDQKFRLVIGPVDGETYDGLLPGGDRLERVRAIVRGYLNDQLEWDVRLLAKQEVRQPMALATRGRLGYSSWLGPRPHIQPLQDVVFEPARVA